MVQDSRPRHVEGRSRGFDVIGRIPACLVIAACLLGRIALFAGEPVPASVGIALRQGDAGHAVVVTGLTKATLDRLANDGQSPRRLASLLRVYVGADAAKGRPSMLGDYRVEDGQLIFTPRFPLRPGMAYRAVIDPAAIFTAPEKIPAAGQVVQRVFRVPDRAQSAPTEVQTVYPTADVLPENQLKFYIYFSSPMTQGDSYRHVRLLDASGKAIELPFVDVGQELWDRSGRRITLLLDPGRIKRGLRPREEQGPILMEGHRYTLMIDHAWPDAAGQPLAETYRKAFRVAAPDDTQPDPFKWRVEAPRRNSTRPVQIEFDEPLDHAMLMHVLEVVSSSGEPVKGDVAVTDCDTRWSFSPQSKWLAGKYEIVVDTNLEDLAGNSIGRPFEVDMFEEIQASVPTKTVSIPFRVD